MEKTNDKIKNDFITCLSSYKIYNVVSIVTIYNNIQCDETETLSACTHTICHNIL